MSDKSTLQTKEQKKRIKFVQRLSSPFIKKTLKNRWKCLKVKEQKKIRHKTLNEDLVQQFNFRRVFEHFVCSFEGLSYEISFYIIVFYIIRVLSWGKIFIIITWKYNYISIYIMYLYSKVNSLWLFCVVKFTICKLSN